MRVPGDSGILPNMPGTVPSILLGGDDGGGGVLHEIQDVCGAVFSKQFRSPHQHAVDGIEKRLDLLPMVCQKVVRRLNAGQPFHPVHQR